MVPPQNWVNYEKVLGVTNNLRHYDYDVYPVRSSVPTGVWWPDDKPAYTIAVANNGDEPMQIKGRIDIIRYGTRGRANDVWLPKMVKLADIGSLPVDIDIPAHGKKEMEISPAIPSEFGGYALVMDLGKYGRRLVTSLVRTYAANPRRLQYPRQALDDMGADFLHRVGVQAIRMGVDYTPTTAPDFAEKMEALDKKLKEYKEKNITVLLMFGAGGAPQPLGMPRAHLDSTNTMRKTKQDFAWLPSADADFKKFVQRLCVKYGWPAGPVTAVSLWNEPWEGMSISGWQADIPRYREIYTAMASAVLEARKTGAEVLVGGGDSNSNAWDKLFADGKMTFLPIFDFCSIHYQGIESPALYPEWVNRQSPNGRVRIWDTESWVGNTDDRIGLVVATGRSAGYDRTMGIFAGYMYTVSPAGGHPIDNIGRMKGLPDAWSPAAAVGAVQHLVGEREFDRLLFKGLPWVMLFKGYDNDPEDGTVVVAGDIGETFGRDHVLFRSVQLAGGTLTLPADAHFRLYDFYGNAVNPTAGKIVVPLNSQGYYLRTDGAKGAFARLVEAIKTAHIRGVQPVEIIAKDMLSPVSDGAVIRLQLTNMLNRSVSGKLHVSAGYLGVAYPEKVVLAAHEVLTVPVKVLAGRSSPDNSYHLSVMFDAGVDGLASHEEDMHVNQVSRRSIKVDGVLDDWRGALPQTVSSGAGGPSLTEAAWYPFKNFDTRSGGYANGYFAYDDRYFYFAAKVADSTPHPGTYRFEHRPDDEFFYPDTAYQMDMMKSLVTKENGSYWESGDNTNSCGVDLQLPEDHPTRVTFYLPNIKVSGLLMDIWDANGRLLENRRIDKLWDGVYESFTLKGKVRVAFHAWGWWYSAKLGGIFFDPPAPATEDFDTKSSWKGVYGHLGYYIPGDTSHLPAGVGVNFARVEIRNPLVWPAGVRHFTYRKGPVTPDNSGLGYSYDNVLLAFNALPEGQDGMLAYPPGTLSRYTGYKCTDYEYAMNPVAAQYGGGTEMWRLLAPGLNRKHFFPRQPKSEGEGPVKGGQLVIRRDGNTVVTECAIPWSELPDVKKAMDEGRTVKLSFRVNDNSAPTACMELARDRSVSKVNARAFHPDWKTHWANEVEFSFEKNNTTVFQHRIDSCSEHGGGVVRIPAGKYVIGTLYLKDNVELHLEQGAFLLGSTRLEDYTRPALLYAENARNIAITGPGTVDGQGGDSVFQKGDNGNGRPRIIHFIHCTRVRIEDITLRNSPFWVQYYSGCDTVNIHGIRVYSHCNWNNDGLDIDSRNVTVSDCTIDSDDDALCLKSETPGMACENVRVTNCRLASNCNAIKLGTASRVGFRHIFISNCTVDAASQDPIRHWRQRLEHITADRTVLAGIAVETVDGGESEDINIDHIRMDHVQTPVFIRLGDRQRRTLSCMPPAVSRLKDIAISHIRATAYSRISSSVTGLPGADVENVYLNDIHITCPGGGTAQDAARTIPEMERSYPENRIFGNSLPASGFYFRHVKGLSVQGMEVRTLAADQRSPFVREDVSDRVGLPEARFKTGDDPAWRLAGFDDRGWETIRTGNPWEEEGHAGYNGYAWYRMRFFLPASLAGTGDSVRVFIGKIDDADEVYLNGELIGKTGSFPADKDGYITKNYIKREYHFARKDALLRWNKENTIAVRVYDGSGNGGIYPLVPYVAALGGVVSEIARVTPIYDTACILTPKPSATPRINGAKVFGIRPGSPFLYKIAATGAKPLHYGVKDLPAGLSVDSTTGIITGVLEKEGEYHMRVGVSNSTGRAERGFTVKVGQMTALTPPMGWNSWNCWGLSVDDEKVRSSARALLDKGLAEHGWNYINIDDAWQARARTPQGGIIANEKFPDMKALGDWLHGNGLKFGIYSSPGDQTCGRYTGSLGHEAQDAATYARWGVDYLKYDWCSYGKVAGTDTALDTYIKPYRIMDQALRAQHRDILYSLCQYGMKGVWKWGRAVGANCWRTTGDITDSWASVLATGFSEAGLYPYAGPGHWNDPDMLVVGQIGWGDLHPTRLSPDEQYSHISLWCLLSAPLLMGGDISKMDDFTLGLLTNDEVIALDQDPLGQQARRVINQNGLQLWMKELEDGTKAIGLFNMADTAATVSVDWDSLGVQHDQLVRDCWRQKDLGSYAISFTTALAPHGVRLIKITPKHNATAPMVQNRDALYNWQSRHAAILALNRTSPPANIILGNSIVHFWGGSPAGPFANGGDSWVKWLDPLGVRNMGFGWDRIENVLWRVTHGELDGYTAKHILLMIGTNNLQVNTDSVIVDGLTNLVQAIRERQPAAKIALSGLLPRRGMEERITRLNQQIARINDITYIDPGKILLSADGKIDESQFVDGLHPNASGYRRLAPIIANFFSQPLAQSKKAY